MKIAGIVVTVILLGVLVIKFWPIVNAPETSPIKVPDGPAIVLIRGDNSPNCKAIHGLVEQAEQRYRGKINVFQTDWSADNPLIEHYQIRFLPTVVFIDKHGREQGRIIGESPAVQAQLSQALMQADQLLLK
jgi:thioredoxin-like negative regulator of GroEL